MSHRSLYLRVAGLFLVGLTAFCADWPQWRGPARDGKSPETGLLQAWPEGGLTPLWVAEGLGEGYSAVTVANGVIYVTGMVGEQGLGVLSAFDLAGTRLWRTPYGPEWNEGSYPGARSSATITGGRGYLLSGHGVAVCFDAQSGAVVWSRDVAQAFGGKAPRCGFAESLLVFENRAICTPGGPDASLVTLDKATGETVWTTKGFSEQSAYCSPILIERGGKPWIVTITAEHVIGIDAATGELAWKHPQDPDAEDPNHSVAPVFSDGCLYATSGHGDGGQMLAFADDGRSVEQRWTDATLNTLHGGLVCVDGYVYGTNSRGKWVCLELRTGAVMWEERGVGRGSIAYADGMLYCYGEKGAMGLVKATPEGYVETGRFEVTHGEGQHWAHPVIAGGGLYLRHGDTLGAYAIAKK